MFHVITRSAGAPRAGNVAGGPAGCSSSTCEVSGGDKHPPAARAARAHATTEMHRHNGRLNTVLPSSPGGRCRHAPHVAADGLKDSKAEAAVSEGATRHGIGVGRPRAPRDEAGRRYAL